MAPAILEVVDSPHSALAQTASLPEQRTPQSPLLYHHSLITTSSSPLKYGAAAHLQLRPQNATKQHTYTAEIPSDDLLIASPYNIPSNLLDLSTLDDACSLMARALTIMQPARKDYATAPYTEAFNWDAVLSLLQRLSKEQGFIWTNEVDFYVIDFRSQRRLEFSDLDLMAYLDVESHREAVESGGLLKYWFGDINEDRRNLATCVWRSREDAIRGGTGPVHQQAKRSAGGMYAEIKVVRKRLIIEPGLRGLRIENI